MSTELYNTTMNATIVGLIEYLDRSANYMFLPLSLLAVWIVLLFLNRQNFKFGVVAASFVIFLITLMLKALVGYFSDVYIMLSAAGVLLGIVLAYFF